MTKGTTSFGKHGKKALHLHCRRCGRRSYNKSKKQCSACGFGRTTTIKRYSWKTRNLSGKRIL